MSKYIPAEVMEEFRNKYETGDIWQIHTGHNWITVFLYNNDQINKNKELSLFQEIKEEYAYLREKYLDASEYDKNILNFYFNSKETFEAKYNGDWHSYYT